jgi:hypothetical protein
MYQSTLATHRNTVSAISRARSQANAFTVGVLSMAKFVPGTPQKDLQQQISTIRSNIGFDRLQSMRQDSPTGGALGQVAIQELEALQNSIASLEQSQSPSQFKDNLDVVEQRYAEFSAATNRALNDDRARASSLRKQHKVGGASADEDWTDL